MFFTCVLFSKQFWQQNILDVLLLGFHFPRSPFFFLLSFVFFSLCRVQTLFFFPYSFTCIIWIPFFWNIAVCLRVRFSTLPIPLRPSCLLIFLISDTFSFHCIISWLSSLFLSFFFLYSVLFVVYVSVLHLLPFHISFQFIIIIIIILSLKKFLCF